jgi:hypothetical protein
MDGVKRHAAFAGPPDLNPSSHEDIQGMRWSPPNRCSHSSIRPHSSFVGQPAGHDLTEMSATNVTFLRNVAPDVDQPNEQDATPGNPIRAYRPVIQPKRNGMLRRSRTLVETHAVIWQAFQRNATSLLKSTIKVTSGRWRQRCRCDGRSEAARCIRRTSRSQSIVSRGHSGHALVAA